MNNKVTTVSLSGKTQYMLNNLSGRSFSQKELPYEVNKSKELSAVQYFSLGLSYDHRMINGYEANCFLTELKKLIENPDFKS